MSRQDIEMGPIWDNNDANEKAKIWVSQNPGWRYTGEWRTTVPNVMSTITVEMIPQPAQPMMMGQPMMMAPPMMAPQPAAQGPIIINNNNGGNGGDGNCPVCEKGNMMPVKRWGCWTCCVCMFCICGLCCDCAWAKATKCVGCGHEVRL